MKNREYVELYVSEAVRRLIERKVQDLTGVNHRLYTNKLLYIVSRLYWEKITRSKHFAKNGAKLRTHVNPKTRQLFPEAEKNTLTWLLSTKAGMISNMLETLKDWEVIEPKHEPVIGVSARTWTFHKSVADCQVTLQRFYADRDGAFVRRLLQRKQEQEQHELVKKILDIYHNHVTLSDEGLQFFADYYTDYPAVTDTIAAIRDGCFADNRDGLLEALRAVKFHPRHEMLAKILRREFYAYLSPKNGRVDHNLTSLPRGHRKYLLIDGKPMVETDIVNCQPALSVGLIRKQLQKMYGHDFSADDVDRMERCCGEGKFYEVVAGAAGIDVSTPELRQAFKENILYPEVYFCKNNQWNTSTQVAFRRLFPNAEAAIRTMKVLDHRSFSIDLQRMESDVVVHAVFKQLVSEGYNVLPLHDAVYTNDEEVKEYAEQLIRNILLVKYDTRVTFKGEEQSTANHLVVVTSKGTTWPVVSLVPRTANVA